ncbi:hypothetical protein HNR42_000233 [Deinobacterium chartae]|uniref:Uncharacterized protein n=1 Tax=Deinobacterium chartae TaxID=521158 RepID=A0A841HTS1_9DEIO|nr:hypothetical protein [Deinobacterium chartae]MBB6096821.1 hypothetical protein [Deinobacterium chartae]
MKWELDPSRLWTAWRPVGQVAWRGVGSGTVAVRIGRRALEFVKA